MVKLSMDWKDVTVHVVPKQCKYYNPHMRTIEAYVHCLYDIEGCECGGLLHILLDDDNIRDNDILFCLKNCLEHPEREEARIGQLICEEYLKLSMEERRVLVSILNGFEDTTCFEFQDCKDCPLMRFLESE